MAIGTPFHERTAPLATSQEWIHWSGYYAANSYGEYIQPEYAAIRNSAAVIDVSPLYKYELAGRDACALLDRVVTHHVARLAPGRVMYTPWCDPDGAVRQEGTLFRRDQERYQLNAAEPALGWLHANLAPGEQVQIVDRSTQQAVLAVQGPRSRDVLSAAGNGTVDDLPFFRLADDQIGGVPVTISRTGYTGDLGYEVWLPADRAVDVWDHIFAAGEAWGVTACGLRAMDIARLETGFVLINVDYPSAETALLDEDKACPYTLGLGWAVKLDKGPFVGREALRRTRQAGPPRRVVGLEIPWQPLEAVYLEAGMMPDLPLLSCREPVPVYDREGRQVGRTTTRVWSTLLKKFIALASVRSDQATPGTELAMEVTVHYERKSVPARVVDTPFFRPQRMRE
jgi:aminomethyltransferase